MRRLFTKDLREQLKTYRILIAVIAFALFGLVSPLTMKMLPHMIPVSGTGGFQLTITGEASIGDAASQYMSFVGQMAILLVIIFAMGTVAGDKSRRVASMLLTKPISRRDYLLSKYASSGAVIVMANIVGAVAFYGYTVVLFGYFSPAGVPLSIICTSVFLLMALSLTILFSTLVRSSTAAGGLSLIASFLIFVIPGFFEPVKKYGPGYLVEISAGILARTNGFGSALPSLIVAAILVAALTSAAVLVFNRRDL